jgi:DHA2 family metal-tetracycline-proton antiporter-like MFS transporter
MNHEAALFTTLRVCMLILAMNTTMFTIAMPAIASDLGLSPTNASIVVASYSICFAFGNLFYGVLSQGIRLKVLFVVGLWILAIGSFTGLFSMNFEILVISRVIQAFGITSISALTFLFVAQYFPIHQRGDKLSGLVAANYLGFGMGPILGAFITEHVGWTWLFCIPLISSILFSVFLILWLPREPDTKSTDWMAMPRMLVNILTFSAYRRLLVLAFVIFFTYFTALFVMPFLLYAQFGASAYQIAFVLLPAVMGSSFMSRFFGKHMDMSQSMSKYFQLGLLLYVASLLGLSSFGYISLWLIPVFFFVLGTGYTVLTVSLQNHLSTLFQPKYLGAANGMMQWVQYGGSAFGVFLCGKLLQYHVQLNPLWMAQYATYSNVFFNATYSNVFFVLAVLSLFGFGMSNIFFRKPIRVFKENE